MSPVITFSGTIWLSWNSARLVSLILNSLTGSLLFYEQQQSFLTPDSIFGLRIIEGQLDQLYIHLKDRGHHKDIFAAIRNLSNKASEIASKANNKIKTDARLSPHFEIFEKGFNFKLSSAKLIDDRFRWHVKEHFTEKKSRKWFDGGNKNDLGCIYNLLENFPNHSSSCQESMLKSGLNGYELTTQVFYLTISQQIGCINFLNSTIHENKNYSLNHQILEFCTNIFGELLKFKKDKKKLAKIDWKNLDLMMEQIFICSLHGFVEFVDTHFIVAGLSWQNPKFGCWKKEKPAHLPKFDYENDFRNLEQKNETADDCIAHLTTVTIGALIMALRFLLDPPPWPEFHHAADQLISADTIVAEEKFHIFKYIDWVRDIPGGIHLPRPPPVTWAPDLIAFVFLLLILLIGSIIAHNFCSSDTNLRYGKRKKLYNFAYKKL